jgi:hypothetical protein
MSPDPQDDAGRPPTPNDPSPRPGQPTYGEPAATPGQPTYGEPAATPGQPTYGEPGTPGQAAYSAALYGSPPPTNHQYGSPPADQYGAPAGQGLNEYADRFSPPESPVGHGAPQPPPGEPALPPHLARTGVTPYGDLTGPGAYGFGGPGNDTQLGRGAPGNGAGPFGGRPYGTSDPASAGWPNSADRANQNDFVPAGPASSPPSSGPATSAGSPWGAAATPEADQQRFDAFKPEEKAKTEQPAPKVRNGRVLLVVLAAAVLILVVPLGALWLLGKTGGAPPFNPAVGACVKNSGNQAVPANCSDPGAFTVVSKVASRDKCADPTQPHLVVPAAVGKEQILCLRPATGG